MKRRTFIRDAALSAVAISATGFIRFNGENFEGDCETTTDILGPFYRPNAPVRSDMRLSNDLGKKVVLSGTVMHKDCKTPLKNACVEIWHCDSKGDYDNESSDFKYRAKTYCDEMGNYSFKTIIPIPYEVGRGNFRPAHFHMLISATGYQALITQLYFTGDPYISKDSSSSSPAAKRRILKINKGENEESKVLFNVTMIDKLPADEAAIDRLIGTYSNAKNEKEEFYKKDGMIWVKHKSSINGGYPLEYLGDNTFGLYGEKDKFQFAIQQNGSVKIVITSPKGANSNEIWEAVKGK
jgi:protocatechuate 3,4-dioxygenase beta subunit